METHVLRRVRLTNSNNDQIDPNFLYKIPDWEILRSYDEKVILKRSAYNLIFNLTDEEIDRSPIKRGIVRIQYGNKSIYRLFSPKNINDDEAGLTQVSLLQLNVKEGQHTLNHQDAGIFFGKFMFYYMHPFHEVRVPVKIAVFFGIVSVILGALSIILAITLKG